MKEFAVHVRDSYGATKLEWFDTRQEMVVAYNHYMHLIAMDKGIKEVAAFSLCAFESRENWVKAMGVTT